MDAFFNASKPNKAGIGSYSWVCVTGMPISVGQKIDGAMSVPEIPAFNSELPLSRTMLFIFQILLSKNKK